MKSIAYSNLWNKFWLFVVQQLTFWIVMIVNSARHLIIFLSCRLLFFKNMRTFHIVDSDFLGHWRPTNVIYGNRTFKQKLFFTGSCQQIELALSSESCMKEWISELIWNEINNLFEAKSVRFIVASKLDRRWKILVPHVCVTLFGGTTCCLLHHIVWNRSKDIMTMTMKETATQVIRSNVVDWLRLFST